MWGLEIELFKNNHFAYKEKKERGKTYITCCLFRLLK